MQIKKYVKEVEAVYFDGKTKVQEIADWCGGEVVMLVDHSGSLRKDYCAIDVPVPGGIATAGDRCYIFKDGPSFTVLNKEVFESNFRESDG